MGDNWLTRLLPPKAVTLEVSFGLSVLRRTKFLDHSSYNLFSQPILCPDRAACRTPVGMMTLSRSIRSLLGKSGNKTLLGRTDTQHTHAQWYRSDKTPNNQMWNSRRKYCLLGKNLTVWVRWGRGNDRPCLPCCHWLAAAKETMGSTGMVCFGFVWRHGT